MRRRILRKIVVTVLRVKPVSCAASVAVRNAFHRLQHGYQTANVIETLKRASEICEPSGLVMVGEPLNIYRDHPEFFVSSNNQMYALMKAVGSPSCKILYDIYHTQVNEGNIIPNMDACWDEVAYIQTGDHPGRKEPTTGEINYKNVFRHIYGKGYKGILGMEHGNSKPGRGGEQAVIDAYAASDNFLGARVVKAGIFSSASTIQHTGSCAVD
jgi:hydroxypyruvate isomerase